MITTIYRTGNMVIPTSNDDLLTHWAEFDVRAPKGHTHRQDALYCAADIAGAHYWLNFAFNGGHQLCLKFNEITVESDDVMVYSVEDYNEVQSIYGEPTQGQLEQIDAYWASAMTLTQWMREVGEDEQGQWEILLPVSAVISSRVLSYEELRDLYIEEGIEDERLTMELDLNIKWALEDGHGNQESLSGIVDCPNSTDYSEVDFAGFFSTAS